MVGVETLEEWTEMELGRRDWRVGNGGSPEAGEKEDVGSLRCERRAVRSSSERSSMAGGVDDPDRIEEVRSGGSPGIVVG